MSVCVTIPADVDPGAAEPSLVSTRLVRAIGDVADREFHALSPLYESVDPDALDILCEHARERSTPLAIDFSHDGVDVEVRVSADGEIRIDAAPE